MPDLHTHNRQSWLRHAQKRDPGIIGAILAGAALALLLNLF